MDYHVKVLSIQLNAGYYEAISGILGTNLTSKTWITDYDLYSKNAIDKLKNNETADRYKFLVEAQLFYQYILREEEQNETL